MSVNVFFSRYCWTPEYRGRGSMFKWDRGQVVNLRSSRDPTKIAEVRIDSDLMKHDGAPGNGLVYEVVFLDGSGRWAVSADQIEPSNSDTTEIAAGRVSLGLPPDNSSGCTS